jgi:peptidoglycan/LPS O-acetylase OafA/YrhL
LTLIATLSLLNIFLNERYAENQTYFTILILSTFFILKININLKISYISWVGLISYSWYLIHNAVGLIIIRELNKLELQQYSIISAIFLTLCLSCVSFYFIEMKLKKIILKNYLKS